MLNQNLPSFFDDSCVVAVLEELCRSVLQQAVGSTLSSRQRVRSSLVAVSSQESTKVCARLARLARLHLGLATIAVSVPHPQQFLSATPVRRRPSDSIAEQLSVGQRTSIACRQSHKYKAHAPSRLAGRTVASPYPAQFQSSFRSGPPTLLRFPFIRNFVSIASQPYANSHCDNRQFSSSVPSLSTTYLPDSRFITYLTRGQEGIRDRAPQLLRMTASATVAAFKSNLSASSRPDVQHHARRRPEGLVSRTILV